MKRRLVISDIHGCHDQFKRLLDVVKYAPHNDQLILLGDYVDRGGSSKEVVEQVINMVKEYGVMFMLVLIRIMPIGRNNLRRTFFISRNLL